VVGRGKVRQMLGMPNGTSDNVGMTRSDGGEAGQKLKHAGIAGVSLCR